MILDTGNKTFARACSLTILIALGFAGNYFKLSLFYGFDFLFGSIFLMIILNLFGVGWAVIAALVASSCTYLFWHHPYGIISFTLEILFVGLLLRSRLNNLVLLDVVFWLVIGSPLNWLLYYGVMEAGFYSSLFVIVKQSVNGIFNALIASIILDYLPIQNWVDNSTTRKKIPIQQALFHLILIMILLPALMIMIMNSRKSFFEIEKNITLTLKNTELDVTHTITDFIKRHMEGVNALATLAAGEQVVPTPIFQENIRLIMGLYPDYNNMYIANSAGVTVAFYPEINEQGESMIGMDFSDRPYYQEMKKALRPVISDVFMSRAGVLAPIVTLSVPILKEGQFKGFAIGAINLKHFGQKLERITDAWGVTVTIIDEHNKVVTSTNKAFAPLQQMDWRQKGEVQPLHSNIFKWFPPKETSKSAFIRWKNSFYFIETPVAENIPWHVLLSVPVAPYQKQLYETTYIHTFAFMLIIVLISIFVSAVLSRKLVNPIEKLMNVTTDLPDKVARQRNINWPDSIFSEIHSLVGNFKEMSTSLMQKFFELKKIIDAAEVSAQRLEFVLEGSNDATWEWDLITNQGILNTRYYEMIEYDRGEEESTFEFFLKTIHPEDVSDVQRLVKDSLEGKTREYEAHYRIVTKSGKIKHVMGRGKIVRFDEDGRPTMMAGVVTDVTEMKRLSEEVNKTSNLASIGLLAGGLAHDFNNVLNIIYGNISFAKMLTGDNTAIAESLTDAEEACERAKELGIRLQAFSQGSSPARESIALPAVIEDAAGTLYKNSNILHTISTADDLFPVVADPRQIRQMFENLLTNAKEAMSDGGTVTVRIENNIINGKKELPLGSGNYVCITLQDDGRGIPEENLSKIFDPYFSTKDTYSQRGMGLGLSICHAILNKHRGHISVDSKLDIGTRVRIYLPASQDESKLAPEGLS